MSINENEIIAKSNEYEKLLNERDAIGMKLHEASTELQKIGLPKNFVKLKQQKAIELYGKEKVDNREYWANLILTYQGQMKRVNEQLKGFHQKELQIKNSILHEIFTRDQLMRIDQETRRRLNGEHPIAIDFGVHRIKKDADDGNKYKTIATSLIKTIIQAREKLNDVIREGCNKYGNAEFLKLISPVNQIIKPISELEQIRRTERI